MAIGAVSLTVGLAFVVGHLMPHASLSLLFLTSVLIVSARTGLGPSLVASLLSFLTYNFFFTPPFYTFEVADDGDIATLIFFLLVAAITGNLAAHMHKEMASRRASLQRISNLYEFSRRMSSALESEAVLSALADHLFKSVHRPVAILIANPGETPLLRKTAGEPEALDEGDVQKAWSQKAEEVVALGGWHFFRLGSDRESIGLVAICGDLDDEHIELVQSLSNQAAVALDRTQLVADLEKANLVSETEQLRSALLSSVSHDLRTPLASIIGSASSLVEYGESFSKENRGELLATVLEESQRLDRHIQNLLDMTRLGQGSLTLHRDWVDLHDVVSSAISRLRDSLKSMPIDIEITTGIPLLWIHGVLIEQALVNLLDNAIRFSPGDGRITIAARARQGWVELDVCDEGPGVPQALREKIFDMFYTARQGDRGGFQGTGLGLAICRGMVAAHGGKVSALDGRNGRGVCMRIELPTIEAGKSPHSTPEDQA